MKAYVVGTHLNCLDKSVKAYFVATHLNCLSLSRQFKCVSTTYALIKKKIKIYGCNLKTTKCLTVLIGIYAVIRSNTVCYRYSFESPHDALLCTYKIWFCGEIRKISVLFG